MNNKNILYINLNTYPKYWKKPNLNHHEFMIYMRIKMEETFPDFEINICSKYLNHHFDFTVVEPLNKQTIHDFDEEIDKILRLFIKEYYNVGRSI